MITLLLISMLIYGIKCELCKFNIKVEQTLYNDGFHRNLNYSIDFASPNGEEHLYRYCEVGLAQTLPAGVYASEDEMKQHCSKNGIKVVFITPVDVETPATHSRPFVLQIVSKVKDSKSNFFIPVHARYHEAVKGGGRARNIIPSPKLYLKCPDKKLDACKNLPTETSINTFCHKKLPKEQCEWKQVPVVMITGRITWLVPVGNLDHYYTVAWCTSIIIILASLYLLKNLHLENLVVGSCNTDRTCYEEGKKYI